MSSQGVLLVSSQKIVAFTNVNENLDEQLLLPNIQIAQDIGLQTLLGTQFYTHMLGAAQGSTLTTAETDLLENYIAPYLLWSSVYEALPDIYMRMMNKSVSIGESPNSKAIDKGDLSYLRNIHRDRKEFYSARLMDYIRPRNADFPLYFQFNANEGGMSAKRPNYYSGLQMEGPRGNSGRGYGLPVYTDPTGPNCCR